MTPYFQDAHTTLYHGDCLELLPALTDVTAIISDPPYGMGNNTDSSRFTGGRNPARRKPGRFRGQIEGDSKPFDPTPFLRFSKVALFGANHYAGRLPVGTLLVWIKRNDAAFGTFQSDAEVAWVKGGYGVYCRRDLTMNHATNIDRDHPNQKPVGIMGWCLERSGCTPADLVCDPYCGSGTTLLAARARGIRSIGIELDERWAEAAAVRLSQQVLPLLRETAAGSCLDPHETRCPQCGKRPLGYAGRGRYCVRCGWTEVV